MNTLSVSINHCISNRDISGSLTNNVILRVAEQLRSILNHSCIVVHLALNSIYIYIFYFIIKQHCCTSLSVSVSKTLPTYKLKLWQKTMLNFTNKKKIAKFYELLGKSFQFSEILAMEKTIWAFLLIHKTLYTNITSLLFFKWLSCLYASRAGKFGVITRGDLTFLKVYVNARCERTVLRCPLVIRSLRTDVDCYNVGVW